MNMNNVAAETKINVGRKVRTQTLALIVTLAAAVVLPQMLHLLGLATGTNAQLGEIFLPMHFPIILAGFLAGPIVGAAAGAAAPLISFVLTGMPASVLLPFMVIELAAYGFFAGFLRSKKMNIVLKTALVLLAGRGIRAAAILLAVYVFGISQIQVSVIWTSILTGIAGICLQMVFIPVLVTWVGHRRQRQ